MCVASPSPTCVPHASRGATSGEAAGGLRAGQTGHRPDRPPPGPRSRGSRAGGLHDLAQTRIEVGVLVPGSEPLLQPSTDLPVDRIQLWQPEGGDKGADEAPARKIDALGKRPSQDGETDSAGMLFEAREKRLALCLGHPRTLPPDRDPGVAPGELLRDRLQVLEAAEEGQVVSGLLPVLAGNELGEGLDGAPSMPEAGRNTTHDTHTELLGRER